MQMICKYAIEDIGLTKLRLPKDAQVLTVQAQRNTPQMWVLLDPEAPTVERIFTFIPTGDRFAPAPGMEFRYVGTFQWYGGVLVFHLFEVVEAGNG